MSVSSGRKEELVNLWEFPRDMQANELAFPPMERGSWLGVHREAGLSLLESVEIKCWTVLGDYCVYNRFMVGDK